ncbi:MAG TPA: class I SAM-dependent methyltransferase [Anaerolineales bacterium]|nr:class I SAM-dependent methyltransferase [Anaerolineales bacterium]
MDILNWLVVIAILILIGKALEREIFFYEGVHLGPRVQAWLYDRWSKKYDEGKRESQLHDDEMLAQPIIDATHNIPEPFVLDFATGTGRLSYALLSQPEFKGRIIALDLSQGMLEQAVSKLSGHLDHIEFLRHQSLPLPFPDASFDVVCALEVLELFPNMDEPLSEFTRVLRAGGLLLSTRGTEDSGRKAKVKSTLEFSHLLRLHDFETNQISPWWKLFDRVIAVKNGASNPVDKHTLQDVLQCSSCGQIDWEKTSSVIKCRNCGNQLSITDEAIVLN